MVNIIAFYHTKTTFTHTNKVCVLIEKKLVIIKNMTFRVNYHLDVRFIFSYHHNIIIVQT